MAENKKSFIAYSDWKDTFDALPNDKAGELIKHIFAYVNDEDPKTDDILINAVFASIKNSLKRDLEKWNSGSESRIEKARKAGLASAKSRQLKSTKINSLVQTPTNSTVSDSVSVSVSVSVNDILLEKETKEIFNNWLDYRKEIKKPIKSKKTKIALAKKIQLKGFDISNQVINLSIENGYQGLIWNKNNFNKTPKKEKKDAAEILQERYNLK